MKSNGLAFSFSMLRISFLHSEGFNISGSREVITPIHEDMIFEFYHDMYEQSLSTHLEQTH